MENKTYFVIDVEIRDENGKLVQHEKGYPVTRLKIDFVVDDNESKYKQLEKKMKDFYSDIKVFLPKHQINLSASVFNGISGTYMNMASFYGEENRFVEH